MDYLGLGLKAGIERAVVDMCPDGCPLVSLKYYDTQSSANVALELFQELYARDVKIFVGLATSDEAKSVSEYASEHATDVLLLSPSSTASDLCNYKQLYRMTMDDQGFAQVLYDLSLEMKSNYNKQKVSIQVINRKDNFGLGLLRDISDAFAAKEGKEVASISYSPDEFMADQIISQLDTSLDEKDDDELTVIVLSGLITEAEAILEEAQSLYDSTNQMWILSDALALTDIRVPDDFRVYGLNFRGEEPNAKSLKKELNRLKEYLNSQGLPPMAQPLLAYDAISMIYKFIEKRIENQIHFLKDNMAEEGITGVTDFSSCQERSSGEYSFSVVKGEDNLLQGTVAEKWVILSYYAVAERDNSLVGFQQEGPASTKGDVTVTNTAALFLTRKEVLSLLQEANEPICVENATIFISTNDAVSGIPLNYTYSVAEFPDQVAIPTAYGFTLTGTCFKGNTEVAEVVKVCPPAPIAGTELECTVRVERPNTGMDKKNDCDAKIKGGQIAFITLTSICAVGRVLCIFLPNPACLALLPCALVPLSLIPPKECNQKKNGNGRGGGNKKKGGRNKKYVCTELFRQGHMSTELMLADMIFAMEYRKDHPIIRQGYEILGPAIASLMQKSETVTDIAKHIAIPWAEEMAYDIGHRDTGNEFGAWVMSVGSVVCGFVGAVDIYWNVIGKYQLVVYSDLL